MINTIRKIHLSLLVYVVVIAAIDLSAPNFNSLAFGAAQQGEAKTVERQYAPDRKVDILHITIDVTPDFKARTVAGTTTIKFVPIAKPLIELRLDAIDLSVSSVTSSADMAGYSVTNEAITITFDPSIRPGAETTVTVVYEAEPKRGLYFRTPEMGYGEEDTHIYTRGFAHDAPRLFPNYDYPNERSSSEIICRVSADMTVLSNGRLVSEEMDSESGLKVVRWLQDKPHANYLIALVAGKLKKIEAHYKDIPLAFYTPTSQIEQAQNSFEGTADMMEFYENEIGVPYPWDKYYQAVVQDGGGGMENTTLTILGDGTLFTRETENIRSSQGLVAHELVHQWFGDYVTCKDWSHTWLNEGFATYYEDLYDSYKNGKDSMLYGLYRSARGVLSDRPVHKPIVYRLYADAYEQFDYRTYPKGGWVLHMLRTELGEELFRKCVKTYLERHALSSVVTEDFSSIIEELTGRSYDRFFDQWVYHARHPDLTVSYNWSEKNKLAKVSVEQTHEVNENVMLFHFRTKVCFVIDDEHLDREIVVDSKQHDFYFPLPKEPKIVRFDPDYGLLATVKFEKPTAMLYTQLENKDDVIGRLRAIDALKEKEDKKTISKLKDVLKNDPFYGVRSEASAALREIHTNEAFEALVESIEQPDARVRLQVVGDIGGFYRPESFRRTKRILNSEKNPEILYRAIRNLGQYHHKDTRCLLMDYLKSKSYRNRLAAGAVQAIRMLDEPFFISLLQRTLSEREQEFTSWDFVQGLDTLAYISRNEEDKTKVRNFLAGYVNHPKERIQAGAIRALGTLGDPRAIPVVETFSGDDPGDNVQRTAKNALQALREKKQLVPEEIIQLRETVDKIRKENERLRNDVDDIKKRLDAKEKNEENHEDDQYNLL
ncbi:MAG TPA: M1 family aminopeptidase [Sedimentisphaerales bacterium]|nr:M1 family aminopeptidase [Sedimentisphaerales bacterium]